MLCTRNLKKIKSRHVISKWLKATHKTLKTTKQETCLAEENTRAAADSLPEAMEVRRWWKVFTVPKKQTNQL